MDVAGDSGRALVLHARYTYILARSGFADSEYSRFSD